MTRIPTPADLHAIRKAALELSISGRTPTERDAHRLFAGQQVSTLPAVIQDQISLERDFLGGRSGMPQTVANPFVSPEAEAQISGRLPGLTPPRPTPVDSDVAGTRSALGPLVNAGVISPRDAARHVNTAVSDSLGRQRKVRQAARDIEALNNADLSMDQIEGVRERLVKQYGDVLLDTPGGPELLGKADEIQQAREAEAQQRTAAIRRAMEGYGIDPDTIIGTKDDGTPIFSITPSEQRAIRAESVTADREERAIAAKQREEEFSRRNLLLQELREMRRNAPSEMTEIEIAQAVSGEKDASSREAAKRRIRAENQLQLSRFRQEEEFLQRQVFGSQFGQRAFSQPMTDLGPAQPPEIRQPGDSFAPADPQAQAGFVQFPGPAEAEAAFDVGEIGPGEPFTVNGVQLMFDDTGAVKRVQ